MIDVNVHFGNWPFQRFPFKGLGNLSEHLAEEGVSTAYVSHLGCVFYADPDVFNRELIATSRTRPEVRPVSVVNPHLNGWRDNFEFYLGKGVRAVKIIPSFHNYRLYTKPVFELIEAANEAGCRLMIQMRYEDERERYFALNVYGPKIKQVARLANRFPETEILCLNCYLPEARELAERTTNVSVDIAFAEWLFTMDLLLESLPPDRVYFGSHTPLLITKATVMKLMDSNLGDDTKRLIATGNAVRFLGE